ncbi:MAG: hypothetical protein U0414_01775 [Polyangiaceae bacterium]
MMIAWSFAAHMVDEVARLLRALGKHRYIKEVDHRVHFVVDLVLEDLPAFKPHAAKFKQRVAKEKDLELKSRDPSLWRPATTDDVIAILTAFWGSGEEVDARVDRLAEVLEEYGFELPDHEPWESDPDEPPFPELLTLDWVLLPVDELDADHRQRARSRRSPSRTTPRTRPRRSHQEGPTLQRGRAATAHPTECRGLRLVGGASPARAADYVLRGASKAAKLISSPARDPRPTDEFESGDEEGRNGRTASAYLRRALLHFSPSAKLPPRLPWSSLVPPGILSSWGERTAVRLRPSAAPW